MQKTQGATLALNSYDRVNLTFLIENARIDRNADLRQAWKVLDMIELSAVEAGAIGLAKDPHTGLPVYLPNLDTARIPFEFSAAQADVLRNVITAAPKMPRFRSWLAPIMDQLFGEE